MPFFTSSSRGLSTIPHHRERADPSLPIAYLEEHASAVRSIFTEDTAVDAISSFSEAEMKVLAKIAAAKGRGDQAQGIVANTTRRNLAENSAWRTSMRNAEGTLGIMLTLFEPGDRAEAAKIRKDTDDRVLGDDSALRAQSQYRQGTVDALHFLIAKE